ncbi:MAG: hemerythrin [Candidatus Azotimanducaceae bacterium]|jgi:hemerythrin
MTLENQNSDVETPILSKKPCMLLVDDDHKRLSLIQHALGGDYELLSASGTTEALSIVRALPIPGDVQLILAQFHLSGGTGQGLQLLDDLKTAVPGAMRMLISSSNDADAFRALTKASSIDAYFIESADAEGIEHRVRREFGLFQEQKESVSIIQALEQKNQQLYKTNQILGEAINNLQLFKVCAGVYWLQIPEANLYILCGCPADVVKHLKQKQYIAETDKGETGPNAILLSDSLIQQGEFSNLAEFPILQMLYLQGMIIPAHPGNLGIKPVLIGREDQVNAQLEYIYRGNYGLTSVEEIMQTGLTEEEASRLMRLKLAFAFGEIKTSDTLLDTCPVANGDSWTSIRNGVKIRRKGFNRYEFKYNDRCIEVNLNLAKDELYESPYQLGFHPIAREYFAILHVGEGDGWDTKRPAMSSIVLHQGDVFLIDAGPNIFNILLSVGIDISEIKGIFHTHCHDDHFAGLPALMQADHRIRHYATPLVRASIRKKLSALMSMPESCFSDYFEEHDLKFDEWNDIDGLEVKPIFSPHPVENSLFVFRAVGGKGYKTYGHWADLSSRKVLDSMVTEDSLAPGISAEWNRQIQETYLTKLDLKKIDIGGGLIHGAAEDFKEDPSNEIVLAHTARTLTVSEKEIGDTAAFAAVDVLIESQENYFRDKAMQSLIGYFPEVTPAHLRAFLNSEMQACNPGETILATGESTSILFLLVTGSVEKIEKGKTSHISSGSFVGEESLFTGEASSATFRCISHVVLFQFSHEICRIFLENSGIGALITALQKPISALKQSWLFDDGISTLIKNRIARGMIEIVVAKGDTVTPRAESGLYLVDHGELSIAHNDGSPASLFSAGDHFGEENLTSPEPKSISFTAAQDAIVYFIPAVVIKMLPLVHWRLRELRGRSKA